MEFLSNIDLAGASLGVLLDKGLTIGLMAFAIKWLNGSREKIEAQREEERIKRWGDVQEHIGSLKARIAALESEVTNCHKERRDLQLFVLASRGEHPPTGSSPSDLPLPAGFAGHTA